MIRWGRDKIAIGFLIVCFFVFPFVYVLTTFDVHETPDWSEIFWAAKNTFLQASLSAALALLLGLITASGLLWLDSIPDRQGGKWAKAARLLCLLPQFIPVLFIVISLFSIIDPFPLGIWGIVLVHGILNFGLVALALAKTASDRLARLSEVAWIEGASKLTFYYRVFLPLLSRDLFLLYIFVFAICFGSFSVPLLVGGGLATTLEVLMYEKIRMTSDWGGAGVIALIQSMIIFSLSITSFTTRNQAVQIHGAVERGSSKWGLAPMVLAVCLVGAGYLQAVFLGWQGRDQFGNFFEDFLTASVGTFGIGLLTAMTAYAFLMLVAFAFPLKWLEIFLNGYVAPGTALVGFAFLVSFPNNVLSLWIKIALVLVLVNFTTIYRMGWRVALNGLQQQIDVAQTLGANSRNIFVHILWPQIHKKAIDLVILIVVWACGDFAVSRILATKDFTLAMQTETMMSSYRLPQAALLSVGLIFVTLATVAVVKGVGRVLDQKFEM